MKSIFAETTISDNRRKFERVEVNFTAQVYVGDEKNKRVGVLRQIGRGGMMIEPEKEFRKGKRYKFIISDRSENIKLEVKAICRYADMRRAGFEFDGLDVHSAVDVGILIGKYYQTDAVVI